MKIYSNLAVSACLLCLNRSSKKQLRFDLVYKFQLTNYRPLSRANKARIFLSELKRDCKMWHEKSSNALLLWSKNRWQSSS